MLLTIDKRGSKMNRNSVFDCHLSPFGRQMAIKNSVSSNFSSTSFHSIKVFDCRLPGVIVQHQMIKQMNGRQMVDMLQLQNIIHM